jgi:predicted small secreted protein
MKTMINLLPRAILAAGFLAWVTLLLGCHTAHGFGQDVENAGEKIQQKTE